MKKFLFILTLALITIGASLFMVFESAAYFQTYYGIGSWKPFYLATLLEVFLLSLSVIKYGELWFKVLQNTIMVCIFVVIVVSSGLGSVQHVFQAVDAVQKEAKIEAARKAKIDSLEVDSEYFRNKARSEVTVDRYATNKNQAYDSYIRSLEESGKASGEAKLALVNIILLILVRFLIQSANLVCARSIGVVYRSEHLDKKEPNPNTVKEPEPDVADLRTDVPVLITEEPSEKVNWGSMYAIPKETPKVKCKRNRTTGLYEILDEDIVLAKASTAREAWKQYKN